MSKQDRDAIVKQNLEFMFARDEAQMSRDPDKRMFVRHKRVSDDAGAIRSFEGQWACLSPFHEAVVYLPGDARSYPTVEHALQASKSNDAAVRDEIAAAATAIDAKKLTSKLTTDEWRDRSVDIMEALLSDKFIRHKPHRAILMQTEHRNLIYENSYGDGFWGVKINKDGTKTGQNKLGELLLKIRSEIEQGADFMRWVASQFDLAPPHKIRVAVDVERDGATLPDARKLIDGRSIVRFGKAIENDIALDHPSISRRHACVVVDNARGPLLVDLDAANGTTLDGTQVSPFIATPINDRTKLMFGASKREYTIRVDMEDDERRREELYAKLSRADPNADHADTTVFVANLPFTIGEGDLFEFFATCGNVLEVRPKPEKGIAFVVMADSSSVVQALTMDGEELQGRKIKVKRSEPRKRAERDVERPRREQADAPRSDDRGRQGQRGDRRQEPRVADTRQRRSRSRSDSRARRRYDRDSDRTRRRSRSRDQKSSRRRSRSRS